MTSKVENPLVDQETLNDCVVYVSSTSDVIHSIECCLTKDDEYDKLQIAQKQHVGELEQPDTKRALQNFLEGGQVHRFRKNQTIFYEGNHPKNIFFIRKGKVKVFKMNEDGKELIMRLNGENEFFGYVYLLENLTYKVSAKAIENCEIVIIAKSDFEALINSNVLVLKMFIRLLADEVVDYEDLLLGMAYNSLRKKVAETLLRLITKFEQYCPEGKGLKVSRQTLAALAGTATESLIRTLSDFKREKLIDINDGIIRILDIGKLTRVAN